MIKTKIIQNPNIDFCLDTADYTKAAIILFDEQTAKWQLLKERYDKLNSVKIEEYAFKGFKIKTQYNPGRITSSSAKTDKASISMRDCFLCVNNLPKPQQGILIDKKYLLLCNPFPIFPKHFTISSVKHVEQRIIGNIKFLLKLNKWFSEKFTIIYNSAACGASAPDHFHFQMGTKNFMPIEDEFHQLKNEFGKFILDNEELCISSVDDGLRKFLLIESQNDKNIIKSFKIFYSIYEKLSELQTEPHLNIISKYNPEFGWSMIIFLREKHRPDLFYNNDNERFLISPAAVDLGGLLIVPRKKDFIRMNGKVISKIFREVSLNNQKFLILNGLLKKKFN